MSIQSSAAVASFLAICVAGTLGAAASRNLQSESLERGRYVLRIAGCNDCHTAGYMEANGELPESQWLTGDTLGWQGPWGTTYAPNLRLRMQDYDEEQWLMIARNASFRPPMPSPSLHAMSEDDLRAVYRFIRALGPAGVPAPAYVPPGQPASGPVVSFPAPPAG